MTEEWTTMHAAARIACSIGLDGSASQCLEDAVRETWEGMQADGVEDIWEYAKDVAPISNYKLWNAFAESSALRIALDRWLKTDIPHTTMDLESIMRGAYTECVGDALHHMEDAIENVKQIQSIK